MKKLLLVIDNLGSGGAQNQLSLLAVELKNQGYTVDVFTYFEEDFFIDRLRKAGISIHHVKKKGKIGIKVIYKLSRLINVKQYHTIISFLDTPNLYAALARIVSPRSKLIISYRSKTSFSETSFYARLAKGFANRQADAIISNSYHERATWIEKYPYLDSKWRVIYNAVDSEKFFPSQIDNRKKHYLVVGSVGPWKNGILIIKALAKLKENGIKINIRWVGKKNRALKHRNEYINQMESLIEKHKLNNQWKWVSPTQKIEEEYKSCKALILASKVEGLPNVVCEALSCATPCIVSNVLDHPLIIENYTNGLLFDPNNHMSLTNALSYMENLSTQEKSQMSLHAKSSSKKLFSSKVFRDAFIQVIENV